MKKNYSVKAEQKKRKIVVSNYNHRKEIKINGLRDFVVVFYQSGSYSDMAWNCHGGTYQISNVLTQIFGKNTGFTELTEEEGEQMFTTLLNTFETLGHEVIYE